MYNWQEMPLQYKYNKKIKKYNSGEILSVVLAALSHKYIIQKKKNYF
jgi:hypothetical protein